MNGAWDAGFITVMAAPSSCRGNEGVFNLHNVTNVVSDVLFILIMKHCDQPTKLRVYTLHLLQNSRTTVCPLPSRRADSSDETPHRDGCAGSRVCFWLLLLWVQRNQIFTERKCHLGPVFFLSCDCCVWTTISPYGPFGRKTPHGGTWIAVNGLQLGAKLNFIS